MQPEKQEELLSVESELPRGAAIVDELATFDAILLPEFVDKTTLFFGILMLITMVK